MTDQWQVEVSQIVRDPCLSSGRIGPHAFVKQFGDQQWCRTCGWARDHSIHGEPPEANTSVEQTPQPATHAADGWANDAHYLQRKIESLRHHVRALQMLIKGQHSPLDFTAFAAEVDAIDRALEAPLRESSVATKPEAK